MEKYEFTAPTYYGTHNQRNPGSKHPEFGGPTVPLLVCTATDGLRIVLGTHDYDDGNAGDVQIERRPHGWAIFLKPPQSGDPSGVVYFLDDGRSYLMPERGGGSTPPIEMIERPDEIPALDQ